jgi:hypothetical protein
MGNSWGRSRKEQPRKAGNEHGIVHYFKGEAQSQASTFNSNIEIVLPDVNLHLGER